MSQQFAQTVKAWTNATQDRMDFVLKRVALDILMRLIRITPVDTGRARANWLVGVGKAPEHTLDIEDPEGRIDAARAILDDLVKGRDQVIFLVNNLPYILKLEYGSSKQAPQGMVRVTLTDFNGIVQDAVRVAMGRR